MVSTIHVNGMIHKNVLGVAKVPVLCPVHQDLVDGIQFLTSSGLPDVFPGGTEVTVERCYIDLLNTVKGRVGCKVPVNIQFVNPDLIARTATPRVIINGGKHSRCSD